MAALSKYLEEALLEHVLHGMVYTPPGSLHLALFTSPTTDTGGGNEVSGGSYSRKVITFTSPEGSVCFNTNVIEFTNMPSATVTHLAIMDAATGGNMLWHGPLDVARTYAAGQTARVEEGVIVVELD